MYGKSLFDDIRSEASKNVPLNKQKNYTKLGPGQVLLFKVCNLPFDFDELSLKLSLLLLKIV